MENAVHAEIERPWMFVRTLDIKLEGRVVGKTPLLIPAFSSKILPQIGKAIKSVEEYITDPILISSYDIYYRRKKYSNITLPINFGQIIFLDSESY